MNINEAIDILSNCNPVTKEYEEAFQCAVECMKFARDFLPLNASPERMKHALNLLSVLEYIFDNQNTKDNLKPIATVDVIIDDTSAEKVINVTCNSESDHEWECIEISTEGTSYICKKCYARKILPY